MNDNPIGVPRLRTLAQRVINNFKRKPEFFLKEVNGVVHIGANHGQERDLYAAHDFKELWSDVSFTNSITLNSVTLSSLVTRERIDLSKYDSLVMDTQGSELLILKGAVDILPKFRFIKTEVPDFEAYQNCCRLSDVDDFLRHQGFLRVAKLRWVGKAGIGSYFDVTYKRG